MPFDVEKIKRESKANYEKTWLETKDLLKIKGSYFELEKKGQSHLVNDFIFDVRKKMACATAAIAKRSSSRCRTSPVPGDRR